jgi:HSP20 family protein
MWPVSGGDEMADLARWDPVSDIVSLREAMNRLFEDSFIRPRDWPTTAEGMGMLPLDVYESNDEVTVRASIPGVNPDNIDISVIGATLTIKGEKSEDREEKKGNYHLRERHYGAFQRSVNLPSQVNVDRSQAEFKDGVLTLTLPKVEAAKPRSIKIKAGS